MYGNIQDPASESRIRDNVRYYSTLGPEAVSERIRQLDREAEAECTVVSVLSGLGAFGLLMGLLGGRTFRLLAWISLPLLFAFSMGKWAPDAGVISRWGLRSRKEIEEERYALKALRGDFAKVQPPAGSESENLGRMADNVMDAVRT